MRPVSHPVGQSVSQLWQQHSEIIQSMWCMCLHLSRSPCLAVFFPPSLSPGSLPRGIVSLPECLTVCISRPPAVWLTHSPSRVCDCALNVWNLHSFTQQKSISVWLTTHWSANSFFKFCKGVTTKQQRLEEDAFLSTNPVKSLDTFAVHNVYYHL